MPIYEYRCKKCNQIVEELQDFNDEPLLLCPNCSGKLVLIISRTSVNVKYGSNELYEKEIQPEAKRIAELIKAGDEDTAADFFGIEEK